MRKVCPQCGGKGKVRVNLMGLFVDALCLDCDETGYIEVPEEAEEPCEEAKETANADNQ